MTNVDVSRQKMHHKSLLQGEVAHAALRHVMCVSVVQELARRSLGGLVSLCETPEQLHGFAKCQQGVINLGRWINTHHSYIRVRLEVTRRGRPGRVRYAVPDQESEQDRKKPPTQILKKKKTTTTESQIIWTRRVNRR